MPWPSLADSSGAAADGAKDAAVVVAIEDYVFLQDVPGALENGEAWGRYFLKARGIPASRVALLFNSDATNFAIVDAVERMAASAQPGGKVWFVFTGHGAPNEASRDGMLVAVDAQQSVLGLEHRSVPQSDVLSRLEKSAATPIAVIDACFSGRGRSGEPLIAGLQPSFVVKQPVPTRAIVMTAAHSDQFAGPLPGAERPAFSYLVLGALRGWGDQNNDGAVTATEAVQYASETLRILLGGKRSQSPELIGMGDVTIATAKERGPDVGSYLLRLRHPSKAETQELLSQLEVVCPSGARWDGTRCVREEVVSAVTCPATARWDGTQCIVAVVQCPPGSDWNGAGCQGRMLTAAPMSATAATPPPAQGQNVDADRALAALAPQVEKKIAEGLAFKGTTLEVINAYRRELTASSKSYDKLQAIVTDFPGTNAAAAAMALQGALYDRVRTALYNTRPPELRMFDYKTELLLKRAESSDNPDLQEKADAARVNNQKAWRDARERELSAVDGIQLERYATALGLAQRNGYVDRTIARASLRLLYYNDVVGEAVFNRLTARAGSSKPVAEFEAYGVEFYLKNPDPAVTEMYGVRCRSLRMLCEARAAEAPRGSAEASADCTTNHFCDVAEQLRNASGVKP